MTRNRIDVVKVFSATKARERNDLGDRIAVWLHRNSGLTVLQAIVARSSYSQWHCFSVVLLCGRSGT